MSPGGVVGIGDGFDITCVGCIESGVFIPVSFVHKIIVVVVGIKTVVVNAGVPVGVDFGSVPTVVGNGAVVVCGIGG